MAHIDPKRFGDDGSVSPDILENTYVALGGEKGIKARQDFRKNVGEATETFRDALLRKPEMGEASRRCLLEDVARALEDAAIKFQAEMNTTEKKV